MYVHRTLKRPVDIRYRHENHCEQQRQRHNLQAMQTKLVDAEHAGRKHGDAAARD
jgi:hypothetical protein